MKTKIYIVLLLGLILGYGAYGQYRSAAFTASGSQTQQTVSLLQDFEADSEIALSITTPIYSFSVTGNIKINDTSNSLVRILLVDEYGTEYLVYEVYPLLTDQWQFDFENMAFETSNMQGVNATKLKIVVLNAKLTLTEYHYDTTPTRSTMQRAKSQQQYVIETLNANLRARNIPWVAGETSISSLSYEEKKQLFGGTVPNLNGFEYYKGGIFVMPGYQPQTEQESVQEQALSSLPTELDWRNKDGKNWMTSVKDQGGCGSCWAFAAVGTVEAYSNIYFQHLVNLDLSEQELVSCAAPDGCSGYNHIKALSYIKNNGVVDENCFSYRQTNGRCANKCTYPEEKIWIDKIVSHDYTKPITQDDMKQWLSQSPILLGIRSWNHAIVLSGYKKIEAGTEIYFQNRSVIIRRGNSLIGSTAWLIKNSWGTNYGNNGYAYIVLGQQDSIDISILQGKVTHKKYSIIETTTYWNITDSKNQAFFIRPGGILNVSATIDMRNESIIVENGGKLIVNGGTLNNVDIEVQSGGQLQIINNGAIKLFGGATFDIKNGATLEIISGSIN